MDGSLHTGSRRSSDSPGAGAQHELPIGAVAEQPPPQALPELLLAIR